MYCYVPVNHIAILVGEPLLSFGDCILSKTWITQCGEPKSDPESDSKLEDMFVMNIHTYNYINIVQILCVINIYYILYNFNKYNINTQISIHRELRQRDC